MPIWDLGSSPGTAPVQLLLFGVASQRYAMPLEMVERVIRAVELNPLPGFPTVIRGIFSLHGRTVPVADIRRRLGLPDKDVALDDRIVILRTATGLLGVLTDGDTDVAQRPAGEFVAVEAVVHGTEVIEGIRSLDGLVLIKNVARFLSLEETPSPQEGSR
jgi:purine-binding chemotaxis protein CheW